MVEITWYQLFDSLWAAETHLCVLTWSGDKELNPNFQVVTSFAVDLSF